MARRDRFQVICRFLRQNLRPQGPSEALPVIAREDWLNLVFYADGLEIAPFLHIATRHLTSELIPDSAREFLRARYLENAERNRRLRLAAIDMIKQWNKAGIIPMLLKGSVWLFDPPGGNPAPRFMNDLDILVQESELDRAEAILKAAGYWVKADSIPEENGHHIESRWSPDGFTEIELHRRAYILASDTDGTGLYSRARRVEAAGCRFLIPSPADLLIINCIHAQISDAGYDLGYISLRQLLDHALYWQAYGGPALLAELPPLIDAADIRAAYAAWSYAAEQLLGSAPGPITGPFAGVMLRRHLLRQALPAWPRRLEALISRAIAATSRQGLALRHRRRLSGWMVHWQRLRLIGRWLSWFIRPDKWQKFQEHLMVRIP